MMKTIAKAAMIAAAFYTTMPVMAYAEKATPSVQYHGGKKSYDRKIEQAAIQRAADKIGDLRGSLEGQEESFIILENELKQDQSSHLGFPIMQDLQTDQATVTGSVPLI